MQTQAPQYPHAPNLSKLLSTFIPDPTPEVIVDPRAGSKTPEGDPVAELIYRLHMLQDDYEYHQTSQLGVDNAEFIGPHLYTTRMAKRLLVRMSVKKGVEDSLMDEAVTRLEAAGIQVALPHGEQRLVLRMGEVGFTIPL